MLDLDIAETAVVGDEIGTLFGIGVVHLQLGETLIHLLPDDRALAIEQNAIASAHDGHLGQVIGIVVTLHYLAQRRTAVAEHVNL